MRQLRNVGIYRPPGGLRPVYAVYADGVWYLYDSEHGAILPPRFTVHSDGTVTNWHGERVGWTAEAFIDTGERRGGVCRPPPRNGDAGPD
jgi:hypothetical protein